MILIDTVPAAPVDWEAPTETVIAMILLWLSAFNEVFPPADTVEDIILASVVSLILFSATEAPNPTLPPIDSVPPTAIIEELLVAD